MNKINLTLLLSLFAFACLSQTNETFNTPIRIAVVQQDGNPGQVELNRNKALKYAKEAIEKKADVILFPEELLVGYVDNMKDLAEPLYGPTTKAFQNLLKGTNSFIIYGLTEKAGNKFYITAVVVSEEGIVTSYRKTHLCSAPEGDLRNEPDFFTAGNELVTFDIKGVKSGLMICYDGDFPEMTATYAKAGCLILFWMNNRGSRGNEEVKYLARRNSIIMPVSCTTGLNEKGDYCPGGSNITGAKGEILSEIWNKEGIIISDVYPQEAKKIRNNNTYFKEMRPDLYFQK